MVSQLIAARAGRSVRGMAQEDVRQVSACAAGCAGQSAGRRDVRAHDGLVALGGAMAMSRCGDSRCGPCRDGRARER